MTLDFHAHKTRRSVPMASALLMLLNPKRYSVIDIRV